MNDGLPRATSPAPAPAPLHLWILCGFLISPFGCLVDPLSVEQFWLGWHSFPTQAAARMTVDGPMLVLGGFAVPVFVGLLAVSLRRWSARRPLRTAMLSSGLFLAAIVSGTALVGIGHQFVWLLQGTGPKGELANSPPPSGPVSKAFARRGREQFYYRVRSLTGDVLGLATSRRGLLIGGTMTADGRPLHGWVTLLGGYAGISTEDVEFQTPWNEEPNARLFRCQTALVVNPSVSELFDSEGFGLSHIAANIRAMPIIVFDADKGVRQQRIEEANPAYRDGRSTTILLGQVSAGLQPWGSPRNVRDPAAGLGTPGGFSAPPGQESVLVGMADGSVRSLSLSTSPEVLRALATPDGGEPLPPFDD